jgi:hypothetical protein
MKNRGLDFLTLFLLLFSLQGKDQELWDLKFDLLTTDEDL